jgi:Domain of unknown function (DUF1877)
MSMVARFVAITPDQLATIKDTPEMVGGVFALDAGLPSESPSDLQKRVRRQTPQLVADMIERLPPSVRQQLGRRLGLGENGLPNPGVGNAVLLQLAQREAAQLGIYPGGWETDDRDWQIKAFRTLCDFYAAASEAEQAVVTLIE